MPLVLTESSTFDATVTVPQDGDTRNAASVQGPFQSLTNRTKYLNDQITTRLSTSFTYSTPLTTVTRIVNLNLALPDSNWSQTTGDQWVAGAISANLLIPLDGYLQDGSTLTSAIVYVTPATSAQMYAFVTRKNTGTGPTVDALSLSYAPSSGTAAQAVTFIPTRYSTIDKSTYSYTLAVQSVASGDKTLAAKLVMTVPGLAP